MNLDNLSTYEKRLCLLSVAVMRFKSERYQAGFQMLGVLNTFDVYVFGGKPVTNGIARSWEITPDSTEEEVVDVIAQLEFMAIDSPVVKAS